MAAGAAINSILSLIISFAVVFSPFPLKTGRPVREEKLGRYSYSVSLSSEEKGAVRYSQKAYSFENAEVLMLRAEILEEDAVSDYDEAQDTEAAVTFYELGACQDAKLTVFKNTEPQEAELKEGVILCDAALIETDSDAVFIDMPKNYEALGSSVLKREGSHLSFLRIQKKGRKYTLSAVGAVSADLCDCTVLKISGSKKTGCKEAARLWTSYLEDGEAKWLYDGYYRTVPAAYRPTCRKDGYYRCPASFVINVLAREMKSSMACACLALACWDTVMQNQSEEGFWPTEPESDWLSEDYGISGGFYDTRFNTDLMLTGCLISDSIKALPQKERVRKYADFYLDHLAQNSADAGNGGILAADYSGPGRNRPAHTSLNHQAAEALAAFRLSAVLKDPRLEKAAEKLVLGIEAGGENWIKPDNDLWYSVSADGEYSGKDYESLTYDDLLTLQRYLVSAGKPRSAVIDSLLESKLIWMNSNNIGDYLK